MGTPHVVFNISSDEESGPEDFRLKEPKSEYDWLLEFLEVADDRADDSDEAVLVTAFNPTKKIPKSKSAYSTVKAVDDDDCVILEGDPDASMAAVDDSGDGSDELLIVAEKGQIACRDYPHPRHLCARFPFMSTNHEKHCDRCHCYVCDTIAPCSFWGVGISLFDHCHATDEVEKWKMQRKYFRKENHNSVSVTSGQANGSLPHDAARSTSNSPLESCLPSFNTTAISSDDISASIVRNDEVQQQSASPRSRIQLQPVSPCHFGFQNSSSRVIRKSIRRDRGNETSCLTSRFVKSDTVFKRTTALGAAEANQIPVALPWLAGDPYKWQDSPASVISEPCSVPQLNGNQIAHQHMDQIKNSIHFFQPVNPIQHVDRNYHQQEHFGQISDHSSFQLGIQAQVAADADSNLSLDWLTDNSLNDQLTSAESSRLLPLDESYSDIIGNFDRSSNVGLGNIGLMENQTVPEDPNWLDLSILSPPPTSIDDAGLLGFYFET